MPDISNQNEISHSSLNGNGNELPTVVLEISFEEEDDEFEEFKFLQNKNLQDQ
jgi:hypothetical protein